MIYTSISSFALNAELKTQFAPFTGDKGKLLIVCQKLNLQLLVCGLFVIMNFNGNTALGFSEFVIVVSFGPNIRSCLNEGEFAMIHSLTSDA